MDYTPQQVQAFLILAGVRRRRQLGEQLQINALGARGNEKAIREYMKAIDAG